MTGLSGLYFADVYMAQLQVEFVFLKQSISLAHNGPRVCEGAEKKVLCFKFAPTLAKPFFYLLIYIFLQIKNGFCGKKVQKFSFALNPLFRKHDVV